MTTEELLWVAVGIVWVVTGCLLVFLSKHVKDWLTPYKLDAGLTEKDNPALGLATSGYFAGVVVIYLGATIGPDPEALPPFRDLAVMWGVDVAWAVAGILALNLSRVLVDRLVLTKFSMTKEIMEDRNVGTGAVEAGALLAGALIIAGAIHGDGSVMTGVVFYVLGQLALIAFARIYQLATKDDIHAEIEADNVPAGVAMGLSFVALGIILLKATKGGFVSWEENLTLFGVYAVVGFLALVLLRRLVDWLFLPGTTIAKEIVEDRSINVAWIEGTAAVGIAAMIFFLV